MPTTAAILTPAGRGAVAVIAVDGPQAAQVVEKFLHTRSEASFAQLPLGQIIYRRWGSEPTEDVIACRRSASQIEIHCHGGTVAAQRILDDLNSAGAAIQHWADWIGQHEPPPFAPPPAPRWPTPRRTVPRQSCSINITARWRSRCAKSSHNSILIRPQPKLI